MIIHYELSSFFSLEHHKNTDDIELECNTISAGEIAKKLDLDTDMVGIIVVNGVFSNVDTILKDYDVVKIFPPIISG